MSKKLCKNNQGRLDIGKLVKCPVLAIFEWDQKLSKLTQLTYFICPVSTKC